MKVIVRPTFEIEVSDWYEGERLTEEEKIIKLKEELSDFSVFMLHFDYENLQDVDVEVIH